MHHRNAVRPPPWPPSQQPGSTTEPADLPSDEEEAHDDLPLPGPLAPLPLISLIGPAPSVDSELFSSTTSLDPLRSQMRPRALPSRPPVFEEEHPTERDLTLGSFDSSPAPALMPNRSALLEQRDYTLILDKSGSMSTTDMPGGKSRWAAAQESTFALASKCDQLDPDGITVYLFSGKFKRYESVTASKVKQIFTENDPMGGTNLTAVLQHALDTYFQRKAAGQTKANGETILVVTDGEPDDQRSVMKSLIEATRKLERDEELAVSFIQIGRDPGAARFLKALDDELTRAGAKFDIVDTLTLDDVEDLSIAEVLLSAIED